jgi:DNA-binding transcriptional MerR regulator
MADEMYDIKELCAAAGVTPRTVHFYIQRGLLPPAGSLGPGARYNEGHASRLKLIKLLQKEHLPLSEIRRQIESLDDAKVQELVREYSTQRPALRSSAVDYIHTVLGGTHQVTSERSVIGGFWRRTQWPAFARHDAAGETHRPPERSQWDRVVLAPDVELHIRRPLSRIENKKIEALIQYARETLKEE